MKLVTAIIKPFKLDEVREAREEVAAMEKRKPRTGRVKLEQRIPEDTREALRRLRERRK